MGMKNVLQLYKQHINECTYVPLNDFKVVSREEIPGRKGWKAKRPDRNQRRSTAEMVKASSCSGTEEEENCCVSNKWEV